MVTEEMKRQALLDGMSKESSGFNPFKDYAKFMEDRPVAHTLAGTGAGYGAGKVGQAAIKKFAAPLLMQRLPFLNKLDPTQKAQALRGLEDHWLFKAIPYMTAAAGGATSFGQHHGIKGTLKNIMDGKWELAQPDYNAPKKKEWED